MLACLVFCFCGFKRNVFNRFLVENSYTLLVLADVDNDGGIWLTLVKDDPPDFPSAWYLNSKWSLLTAAKPLNRLMGKFLLKNGWSRTRDNESRRCTSC